MANWFTRLFAKAERTKAQAVADGRAYLEPSVRAYLKWSPQLIVNAELAADGGNIRLACDLCDDMLADDRISGCLGVRVRSLIGAPLTFEPGAGRMKNRAVKALEAEEDWFTSFPEDELAQLFTWGYLAGISPGNLPWSYRGARVVPTLDFWHPRHLRYDQPKRQWFIRADRADTSAGYTSGSVELPIAPGDGDWILFTPFGSIRPWASGLWRQLSRWWMLKAFAIRDWGLQGEVHGNPIRAGIPREGVQVSKEQRRDLAQSIADMARNSTIVLPPGFDFKLVESTARTYDTFKGQIDMANLATAVAILGQNMTTEPGAHQTGITGAKDVRQELLNSDNQVAGTAIRQQVLVHWAEFNFGNADVAPWPSYEVADVEDLLRTAQTMNTVGDAVGKLSDAGIPVDPAAIAEKFGVPILEEVIGTQAAQKLYAYHLQYGIVTVNEARARLGLEPLKGGDERPMPANAPGNGGDGGGPNPPENSPPAEGGAQARAEQRVLASGDDPETAKGFIDGQAYVDGLADRSVETGTKAMEPSVDAILAAIDKAESYEELRDGLATLYRDMSEDEMSAVVEKALILAELAGRYAVLEDA